MIDQTMANPPHLLLVDGHALAFYCWYSTYDNEMIPGFTDALASGIRRHKASHLIVCFDPPPPTFRHRLYPEYKANRPPLPSGFLVECERVYRTLNSLNVTSYQVSGYEADDVLGTTTALATKNGFKSTVMTCDLDLLQLVNPDIQVEVFSQYHPTRIFTEESARKRFGGIAPANIPDYKGLAGDRSDNLPGVKGIGDVSATALLTNYRDLESIYDNLDKLSELPLRGAEKVRRLLSTQEDQAYKMRTLATIVQDIPISIDFDGSSCRDLVTTLMNVETMSIPT